MASESASSDSQSRWVRDSTLGAGVLVILALYAMVNYLAIRHYQRFDWTESKLHSLTQKSLAVVEDIDEDIDLVLFISPGSPVYDRLNRLLAGYGAANPKLRKREVDPAKNLLEARRLVERYDIERDNVLIVAKGDDRRVIDEFDLAEYDYSGAQMGQPPAISEFKGEQLITSALLALVEAKKPKVLFTTGHGEAVLDRGDARSLSQAKSLLGDDNFEIEEWSPLGKSEVPADADLLVIAGPTTNFLPPELEVLGAYLDGGGRILMMLDPVFAPSAAGGGGLVDLGLTEWLAGYGVEIRDDVVIDPSSELPFFGPETIFTDAYGSHPVVDALQQRGTRVLIPLARSVSAAEPAPAGVEVTPLVETSAAGWGETSLAALDQEVAPDEADVQGPVTLAVAVSFEVEAGDAAAPEVPEEAADAAEDGGDGAPETPEEDEPLAADLPESDGGDGEQDAEPEEARMVVFGDLDFASDAQIANSDNAVLLLNAFNWLVKREELIDIEPRRPERTTMTLSRSELYQVYLLVLVVLPGLAVGSGIWVYLRRRR